MKRARRVEQQAHVQGLKQAMVRSAAAGGEEAAGYVVLEADEPGDDERFAGARRALTPARERRTLRWTVEDGDAAWTVVADMPVPVSGMSSVSVKCSCPAAGLLSGLCEHARACLLAVAEDQLAQVFVVMTYICSAGEGDDEPRMSATAIKGVFDSHDLALDYVNDELMTNTFDPEVYAWEWVESDNSWHASLEGQESTGDYEYADRCIKIEAHWLQTRGGAARGTDDVVDLT